MELRGSAGSWVSAAAQGLRGEPGAPPGASPKGVQGGWRRAQSKPPPVQIPAASHLRCSAKMHQSPTPVIFIGQSSGAARGAVSAHGLQGTAIRKPWDLSLLDMPGKGG